MKNADDIFVEFQKMDIGEQMRFLELLRRMREGILARGVKNANKEVSGLMKRLMNRDIE